MSLEPSTWWWVAAGVIVAAELATGTFYLLMMATGLAGAALAAHAGLPLAGQIVTAAIVGGGATVAWHLRRYRHPRSEPSGRNADMLMDIGQQVQVTEWKPEGSTTVQHRGSAWQARAADVHATRQPGPHVVVAVEGNTLLLSPATPPRPA